MSFFPFFSGEGPAGAPPDHRIRFKDGQILFDDGQIAFSNVCCCGGEIPGGCSACQGPTLSKYYRVDISGLSGSHTRCADCSDLNGSYIIGPFEAIHGGCIDNVCQCVRETLQTFCGGGFTRYQLAFWHTNADQQRVKFAFYGGNCEEIYWQENWPTLQNCMFNELQPPQWGASYCCGFDNGTCTITAIAPP